MKHIHYIIYMPLLLAASCLMGGCGLYGRYSRPALEVSVDSLYLGASPADTASLGSMPWRTLFRDPCLQALVSRALERNADLGIARLGVEEAQAVLSGARLSYLPSATLSPQAGVSHYNGDTRKTYNVGASASWELDVFGRVTNARRGAEAVLMQSRAYEQAVRTSLVATVAESYYALLMLDEQLAISTETLSTWDKTIATLEALVEAGRSNDVAVHRARASRTALEASVLSLRRSVSETENALSALLKEPAHAIERGTLAGQSFPDSVSAGIPLRLLSERPDVRQAEAALAEAFYATNSARAAFYPSLTLGGSVGWTNNGGGGIVNPGKWLSSAVASLTAPLFNRGKNIANLKVARSRQQEATLRFEQTLLEAGNEVNDALAAWQTADGRISLDERQVADLEAAVEKTDLLVRYTPANYLEVLTAQQSLLTARLTLAQDRIGRIQAVVSLYHALGGGR